MHIAIPFDIETVKQSWGQTARMWGRVMGNHTFIRALAEAEACTRLTLLVPGRQDVEILEKTLLPGLGAARTKVTAVPFARLQAHLTAAPVDVMHMLDPNMWFAAHIRARLVHGSFPVTGVTHSLGNQHFLEWALLNNANGVQPDDCLVCSTPTAQAVVESIFSRLVDGQPGFTVPATTVIPFGVSVAGFAGTRSESRTALGMAADTFVVLSLARFNPLFKMDLRPQLHLASRVVARLGRPVKFVLAGSSGDGDYVRFIRDQARALGLEGSLEFVLDPDEARKVHLLRAADVFLSLSDNIQETFGLTPIEAMAAGVPVVASDWDGYRSLIEHGVSGYLVPTKALAPESSWEATLALRYDSLVHLFSAQSTAVDLDAAGDYLVQLADDSSLRETMAAAALVRARRFDWPLVIGEYVELWKRLLAARGAAASAAEGPRRSSALRFTEDFAGYATSLLKPADRFRTTPSGTALLTTKLAMVLYHETDEFLDRELMAAILRHCADGRSVTQLAGVLQGGEAGADVQLGQNVLWLYKYGYLQLD
ncbi:MAG: glycosyltransferase family 4 protein [Gammaproteobacteria bacterium]